MAVTREQVISSFQKYLGRPPSEADIKHHLSVGNSGILDKALAGSVEAKSRKGGAPVHAGVTGASPGDKSDEIRTLFNRYRPNASSAEINTWIKYGDPQELRLTFEGKIRTKTITSPELTREEKIRLNTLQQASRQYGKGGRFSKQEREELQALSAKKSRAGKSESIKVVSKEALEELGGTWKTSGNKKGEVVIVAGDVKAGGNWVVNDKGTKGLRDQGVNGTVLVATGNRSKGLLGKIGLDAGDLPKEMLGGLDVLTAGYFSSVSFGEEGRDASAAGISTMTGMSEKDVRKYGGYAEKAADWVAVAFAGATPAGPFGSAAASAGITYARAYQAQQLGNDIDWGEVSKQVAVNSSISVISNPALRAGASYAGAKALGQSDTQAASAAAGSAAASIVGSQYQNQGIEAAIATAAAYEGTRAAIEDREIEGENIALGAANRYGSQQVRSSRNTTQPNVKSTT